MVAGSDLQRWRVALLKARELTLAVETEMLMMGFTQTGKECQAKLARVENNLATVAWLCDNRLHQPGLFENEPASKSDAGSGGGIPWREP